MTAEQLRELLRKGGKVTARRHWKSFWGNGEDLAALVSWLSSLRLPPVPRGFAAPLSALPSAAGGGSA